MNTFIISEVVEVCEAALMVTNVLAEQRKVAAITSLRAYATGCSRTSTTMLLSMDEFDPIGEAFVRIMRARR